MSSQKLVIIIPYRNREKCLKFTLPKLLEYLAFYKIDYKIIISELEKHSKWNKGICINTAVKYCDDTFNKDWKYFLINDVDIVPRNKDILEYKSYDYIYHPYGQYIGLTAIFFITKELRTCNV